jgi:hypothetical protein
MTTTMMNYIPPLLPIRIQNLTPLSAIGQTQEGSLSLKKIAVFFCRFSDHHYGKRPALVSLSFYIGEMK